MQHNAIDAIAIGPAKVTKKIFSLLKTLLLVWSLLYQNQALADTSIFPPINGLWILPSTHSGPPRPYGNSSKNANWVVGQWNIPEDLPNFKNNATQNRFASVTLGENNSFQFTQDGTDLPCKILYKSGFNLVDEFDILVQPIPIPLFRLFPSLQLNRPRVPLERLSEVTANGSVKLMSMQEVDNKCDATQGIVGIGIIVTNQDSRQTFYYQVSFAVFRDVKKTGFKSLPVGANWFFRGQNIQNGTARQYGYGDRAWLSYNLQPLDIGKSINFKINVLPVIKKLIREAAADGMDQKLSHWSITGAYFGQSAFGHIKSGSVWSNVSVDQVE